jgi:hypothetical protein
VKIALVKLCWFLLVALLAFPGFGQANLPASYHDQEFDITYYYPGHFHPVVTRRSAPASQNVCLDTVLNRESDIASSHSTFRVSRGSVSCLGLGNLIALEAYTRDALVGQLRQWGTPRVTHKPSRYVLDGRPAAVTLAAVDLAPQRIAPQAVYAAKACVLAAPAIERAKKVVRIAPNDTLICFDFATSNPDLVAMMLSFVTQFGDGLPVPLFPSGSLSKR